MILKDQLYTITGQHEEDEKTVVTVRLNPECFIYKAHFPGNPITPGVCIVQAASEVLGSVLGNNLEITEVKDAKFTNILSPVQNKEADFVFNSIEQSDDAIKAKVDVKAGDEVFTVISFTCKPIKQA